MELDDIQLFTLEQIGISIWELRDTDTAIQSAVLLNEQQLQADWLIIHAKDHHTAQKQELLTMMLLAIGIDIINVAMIDSNQLQNLTFQTLTNKILLVFLGGVRLKLPPEKLHLNSSIPKVNVLKNTKLNIFTMYDLADLLYYPDKKFDTWQILKLALRTYNEIWLDRNESKDNAIV